MPNWCTTTANVIGPEADVKAFLAGIKDNEGRKQIISSYFPVPEELQITSTMAWEEIPENWAEWVKDGSWTQEEYDERVEKNNTLLAQQKANLAKYGAKDWYDWCIANWGTKWGDCDTSIDLPDECEPYPPYWSASMWFQTAWGTATQAWEEISRKFPTLVFEFSHDEEAGFFAGMEVIHNGSVEYENFYEPCEYAEEIDWDDDDSVQAHYDWKESQMTPIEDGASLAIERLLSPKPVAKPSTPKPTGKPFVWK